MYTKNARNNCLSNVGLVLYDDIMTKEICKYCLGCVLKVTKDIYIPRNIRYYVTCHVGVPDVTRVFPGASPSNSELLEA